MLIPVVKLCNDSVPLVEGAGGGGLIVCTQTESCDALPTVMCKDMVRHQEAISFLSKGLGQSVLLLSRA